MSKEIKNCQTCEFHSYSYTGAATVCFCTITYPSVYTFEDGRIRHRVFCNQNKWGRQYSPIDDCQYWMKKQVKIRVISYA